MQPKHQVKESQGRAEDLPGPGYPQGTVFAPSSSITSVGISITIPSTDTMSRSIWMRSWRAPKRSR